MTLLRATILAILVAMASSEAIAQVVFGQSAVNNTEVVRANKTATGNTVNLLVGGNAFIGNDFNSAIVVRIYQGATLIAEVGVAANSTWSGAHGLSAGNYTYDVREAGSDDSDIGAEGAVGVTT